MKNYVIVSSRTTNNCSVPVVFQTVVKIFGGEEQISELSRSYVFRNFEAEMPLEMARKLIKEQPEEFFITGSVDKPTEEIKILIENEKRRSLGYKCPFCDYIAKERKGYKSHLRNKHSNEKDYKIAYELKS